MDTFATYNTDEVQDLLIKTGATLAAQKEIERLRQVCRDAYEVWAGSEQIVPVYASEAYLLGVIEQMKDEVKKGLARTAKEEQPCNQHPDAPHGFDRTASHSLGRYVCECEGWEE